MYCEIFDDKPCYQFECLETPDQSNQGVICLEAEYPDRSRSTIKADSLR